MTTITFTKCDMKNACRDTVRVNGRALFAGRVEQIKNAGNGKWQGTASGYDFTIFGGRAAGGASHEWFVQWQLDGAHDPVRVNSAKAALEWINSL